MTEWMPSQPTSRSASTRHGGAPRAVHELAPDAVGLLPEARQMVAGVDARGAEPFEHGPMEHPKQLAAVDGELRPAVAGGQAARLAPDPLAVLGVVGEFGGGDADRGQLVKQTELRQLARRVGHHVDADAQLLHARRRLVDLDVIQTGVVEGQGEGHAADAAARDRPLSTR